MGAMPLPERELIAQVRRLVNGNKHRLNPAVLAGIGDDCAVLRIGGAWDTLVTTDFSLEGMHFRRDWHSADSIGHRCLARGLSDVAAMGGEPLAAFLSLALPGDVPQAWVRSFYGGLLRLAKRHRVTLAGGDTAQSPERILADIVVVGRVPKGKAILRSGARPGDRIFVSGALGQSAAALRELRLSGRGQASERLFPRHFYPEPRSALGRALRERKLATAMIDTSDGVSVDLRHICEESGVGAEIDAARIPRARVEKPAQVVPLDLALHGGEDYELLFTVSRDKRVPAILAKTPLVEIGHVTRRRNILVRDEEGRTSELTPRGWEHFHRG